MNGRAHHATVYRPLLFVVGFSATVTGFGIFRLWEASGWHGIAGWAAVLAYFWIGFIAARRAERDAPPVSVRQQIAVLSFVPFWPLWAAAILIVIAGLLAGDRVLKRRA